MLTLRPSQLAAFKVTLVREFLDELSRYVQSRWPAYAAKTGGPALLRDLVQASVTRGQKFGFSSRDHLTTWVDWECEFGDKFYEREEWQWFSAILNNGLDPAIRIYRLERRIAILRDRGNL